MMVYSVFYQGHKCVCCCIMIHDIYIQYVVFITNQCVLHCYYSV